MKIILHLAVSADGFIAKPDGDSDWVSPIDTKIFMDRAKASGCVVVGRTTFDQYGGTIYPIEGTFTIVLTKEMAIDQTDIKIFFAHSPAEAIALAEERGYKNILVAGGAKTAASFLVAGLVSDIFLSVHPIVLHEGIKPFEDISKNDRFILIEKKPLGEGIEELHYAVV